MDRDLFVQQGGACPACKHDSSARAPRLFKTHALFQGQAIKDASWALCDNCNTMFSIINCESQTFTTRNTEAKTRLRITFDLDGVIANLMGAFSDAFDRMYASDGKSFGLYDFIYHEDIAPILGVSYEWIAKFFAILICDGNYKPYPTEDEVAALLSLDADVAVVTHRRMEVMEHTRNWMLKYNIDIPTVNTEFDFGKRFMAASSYHVEDRLEPIFHRAETYPAPVFFMMDRPWNRGDYLNPRNVQITKVLNWTQLLGVLEETINNYNTVFHGG